VQGDEKFRRTYRSHHASMRGTTKNYFVARRVARTQPKFLKFGCPTLPFLKGGDFDVHRSPMLCATD
jgi:hypothetical protein